MGGRTKLGRESKTSCANSAFCQIFNYLVSTHFTFHIPTALFCSFSTRHFVLNANIQPFARRLGRWTQLALLLASRLRRSPFRGFAPCPPPPPPHIAPLHCTTQKAQWLGDKPLCNIHLFYITTKTVKLLNYSSSYV